MIAETIIQIDAGSLVAGLFAFGGFVGGAILGAAKIITATINRLHEENRQDRNALCQIVNQQWEQLSRVATTTNQIKRKVGACEDDLITRQDREDYDDFPHAQAFDYGEPMPPTPLPPLPIPTPGVPWYRDHAFLAALVVFIGTVWGNWQTNRVDDKAIELGQRLEAGQVEQSERMKAIENKLNDRRPVVYGTEKK